MGARRSPSDHGQNRGTLIITNCTLIWSWPTAICRRSAIALARDWWTPDFEIHYSPRNPRNEIGLFRSMYTSVNKKASDLFDDFKAFQNLIDFKDRRPQSSNLPRPILPTLRAVLCFPSVLLFSRFRGTKQSYRFSFANRIHPQLGVSFADEYF